MKELVVPLDAQKSDTTEFLRAWMHGETIEFATLGNIFPDGGYIGIFAADVVRHLAMSSDKTPEEKDVDLERAVAAFEAEFSE